MDDQKNNAIALLAANGVSADFSCAAPSALIRLRLKQYFVRIQFLTINSCERRTAMD
jgi:hypothetical protein